MNSKPKKYTGICEERRNGWWARCDQLPVAAHGETYNEAIQRMITSIEDYQYALSEPGAVMPGIDRPPRNVGSVGFEVTVSP